jgi:DNA polymerase
MGYTVHQIREQIKVCRACELHKVGHGPVPFSGPAPNLLAMIGEAPGGQEDKEGEPFVGPAGQMLRDCLKGAGIDPALVSYINTVSCYPNRTPNAAEINACATNLLAQLQFVNPTWAVLLGNVALGSQRPDLKVMRARGKVLTPPGHRWKMLVAFHPSFALRQAKAEKILRSDLASLVEMMDAEDTTNRWGDVTPGWANMTDDSCVSCGASPDELVEHGEHLRFDVWNVPYCGPCWSKAPQNQKEEKEQKRLTQAQVRTGQLF